MWICECGRKFENPKVDKEYIGERPHGGWVEYPACPRCKSILVEEMKSCVCGEYIRSYDDYCEGCKDLRDNALKVATETLENEIGISYTEAIELLFSGLEE